MTGEKKKKEEKEEKTDERYMEMAERENGRKKTKGGREKTEQWENN